MTVPAVNRDGKQYGWRCCGRGGYVWLNRDDAEKCCSSEWKRGLAVHPAPLGRGFDARVGHYWLRVGVGG